MKNLLYPTLEEVQTADRYHICLWYRHLHSPEDNQEHEIINVIAEKFKTLGGFTPELSKQIGW